MIDRGMLMTQAAMLRKRLREDGDSPVDVFSLALNIEGLSLVYYPLGNKLSGMCIKSKSGNITIAVNSLMSQGRQRFSLSHEFYHLFYDNNMISVCAKKIDSGKDIEKAADMFASYFLMPETSLLLMAERLSVNNDDGFLSLADLVSIEQYYKVSHQATVYRLMHTPYLDEAKGKKYLNTPVRKYAGTLGFSTELYDCSAEDSRYKTYGNYIELAGQVYDSGMISAGKYDELLLDAFRADLVYGEEEEDVLLD